MSHKVIILIILIAPIVVLTVLRINAALVFLSLCLGDVLVKYVADDAISLMTTLSPHASVISRSTLELALLYAPAVITSVFMIWSVRGWFKIVLNVIPAIGVGFLAILLGVPLFAPGLRNAIQGESLWQNVSRAQAMIVGLTALLSLFFLWAGRRRSRAEESGKHRR
jgi:hypothetical protein